MRGLRSQIGKATVEKVLDTLNDDDFFNIIQVGGWVVFGVGWVVDGWVSRWVVGVGWLVLGGLVDVGWVSGWMG